MENLVRPLNVLIACEESQAECRAFRAEGHNAFSCDIQRCGRGRNPAWHIHGFVEPYLQGKTEFTTQDGQHHQVPGWDLIVAHPPCTYLCKMGSVHMWKDGQLNRERMKLMNQARSFFLTCLNADAPYVAVENPLPMAMALLPKPSFFIQPYWFGSPYSKKTLYWTKNLPPIMPTIVNPNFKSLVRSTRGKYRSRTCPEVAQALAVQWGRYISTVEFSIRQKQ